MKMTPERSFFSFPAGSAGGPDSLRPQHLRDMVLRKEASWPGANHGSDRFH